VHSDIGNACVSAMVDRRLASLSDPLESGRSVEIITNVRATPSPMWLNSVVTAKARACIRQELRAMGHVEAVAFGERMLRRALGRYELALESVPDAAMTTLLEELRLDGVEALHAQMGLGLHLPSLIAERLVAGCKQVPGQVTEMLVADAPVRDSAPVQIASPDDAMLHLSRCCHPIPGDGLSGFFTAGKGVSVHRSNCRNVTRFRRQPREHVTVEWAAQTRGHFEVVINVHLANQPGALARVTSTMSMMDVNIEHMDFNNPGDDNITIRFVLAVENRQQLARIVRRLRNLTMVRFVRRGS